jgi:hypothetical protein
MAGPNVAFIDLEASGLIGASWPVEFGWAFAEGEPQSFLIRPDPSWSMAAWDPSAEKLHGITVERLEREGFDTAAACSRITAALGDRDVYSDAPDWDAYWIMRLFAAAGRRMPFAIREFSRLMPALSADEKARILSAADAKAPRRHRAADDARHLQALYQLAAA